MPPEITAGLMALAAAPPGTASSAGPLLPEPLSASLFAAFLAQSGTPAPKADVPKTNVAPVPNTNPKKTRLDTQVSLNEQILLKSKTMDTLPTLSFPPALKAKVKASELLLPQTSSQSQAPEMPAPALLLAGQAAAALPPLAVFVPVLPAMFAPASAASAPVSVAPAAFTPAPAAFTPAPVSVVPGGAALPIPPASAQPHGLALPERVAPVLPSPVASDLSRPTVSVSALPAPIGSSQSGTPITSQVPLPPASPVLLSQVPAFAPVSTVPASIVSAPTALAVSRDKAPEPMTYSIAKAKPMAAAPTNALPRVASPVSDILQVRNAPQAQNPFLNSPPPPQTPSMLPPAAAALVVLSAVQQGAPTPAAGVPSLVPPKPVPAKNTGIFANALKGSKENTDTSTRTQPGQELTVTAKAGASAAEPEPLRMPEKHTAEQEPTLTAESGTNSGTAALPVGLPASAVKTETKPLTTGEQAEIIRQAADGVGAMPLSSEKPGAAQQMSVQLHPKDWGSLQVSVTVGPQEAGAARTVTAHIVAETPQVKAALQSQTGALHQALRASGLHLEHLTVSVKTTEAKMPEMRSSEVKPAAQSASAGFSSGQGQSDKSGQSYGQPNAGTGSGTNGFGSGFGNGFGNGFGAGGSQANHQGRPPQAFMPAMTDAEPDDIPAARLPLRLTAGRIDTRA